MKPSIKRIVGFKLFQITHLLKNNIQIIDFINSTDYTNLRYPLLNIHLKTWNKIQTKKLIFYI